MANRVLKKPAATKDPMKPKFKGHDPTLDNLVWSDIWFQPVHGCVPVEKNQAQQQTKTTPNRKGQASQAAASSKPRSNSKTGSQAADERGSQATTDGASEPPELLTALSKAALSDWWKEVPPSRRRTALEQLKGAAQPALKQKRIQEILDLAKERRDKGSTGRAKALAKIQDKLKKKKA